MSSTKQQQQQQQQQQPPLSELPTNTTTSTSTATHFQRLHHADIDDSEKKERTAIAAATAHASHAATAKYISPSDAMMSPTSKKLSEIKGRRFGSASSASVSARNMFARMREGREQKEKENENGWLTEEKVVVVEEKY